MFGNLEKTARTYRTQFSEFVHFGTVAKEKNIPFYTLQWSIVVSLSASLQSRPSSVLPMLFFIHLQCTFFYINAVKNLRNTTNTNTLQDDNAGSTEMHCNPAIITYKNTNIYKYKKI